MKINTDDLFSTSDLSLATAISLSFPVWAVDKSDPRRAEFLFKRERDLDLLIEAFWSNTLKVSPLLYFQQLRILKTRLYET